MSIEGSLFCWLSLCCDVGLTAALLVALFAATPRHRHRRPKFVLVTQPPAPTMTNRTSLSSSSLAKKRRLLFPSAAKFDATEVDSVVRSLRDLASSPSHHPRASASAEDEAAESRGREVKGKAVDWDAFAALVAETAHYSHKDWAQTCTFADRLAAAVGSPDDADFCRIFERVLGDGGWAAAAAAAEARSADNQPWIVLVSGLNGIRKTTSIYQPWFADLLHEAMRAAAAGEGQEATPPPPPKAEMPVGDNSFFRQLDFMVATVANEKFKALYKQTDVAAYAAEKEKIFGRHRTIAEMLGVLLVRAAQRRRMNVMVETSGKDVAMFHYIDHLFSADQGYRKLVIHFEIDGVEFAERSVATRMSGEMQAGAAAVVRDLDMIAAGGDPHGIVQANAGGPYGPSVLRDVEAASSKVWETITNGSAGVGQGWYKASLLVRPSEEGAWKISGGEKAFEFEKRSSMP